LNSSPDTFYGSVGVLTCLNCFQFSFTELPMMLPLMMTRGQRKCLNLSLERSQRLWKGLSREYIFVTRLSAFGVSAWDVVTEIDCRFQFQWFHCFTRVCLGDQSTGQVPRFTRRHQVSCSHKGCTSGLILYLHVYSSLVSFMLYGRFYALLFSILATSPLMLLNR
jgi:hypothetical protein